MHQIIIFKVQDYLQAFSLTPARLQILAYFILKVIDCFRWPQGCKLQARWTLISWVKQFCISHRLSRKFARLTNFHIRLVGMFEDNLTWYQRSFFSERGYNFCLGNKILCHKKGTFAHRYLKCLQSHWLCTHLLCNKKFWYLRTLNIANHKEIAFEFDNR